MVQRTVCLNMKGNETKTLKKCESEESTAKQQPKNKTATRKPHHAVSGPDYDAKSETEHIS